MGFVIGLILRKVGMSVRREIIVRLVPRTLFLMRDEQVSRRAAQKT